MFVNLKFTNIIEVYKIQKVYKYLIVQLHKHKKKKKIVKYTNT